MPQTSTTPNSSSSLSTSPEHPRRSYSTISQIEPEKVKQLAVLVSNRDLWDPLEDLLMAARQGYLEELAQPGLSSDERTGACAVAAFIKHFTGVLRDNLVSENEALKTAASAKPEDSEGDPYMDISPDLDDIDPEDLTEH